MFKNILLAVEGVDDATKAARVAGNLARRLQSSSLCIAVAYPPIPEFLGTPDVEAETVARITQADLLAEYLIQEVGTIPGHVEKEVMEGSMTEVAATLSQCRESDLIMLGTGKPGFMQGLTGWFRYRRIMHRVNCPVMLIQ